MFFNRYRAAYLATERKKVLNCFPGARGPKYDVGPLSRFPTQDSNHRLLLPQVQIAKEREVLGFGAAARPRAPPAVALHECCNSEPDGWCVTLFNSEPGQWRVTSRRIHSRFEQKRFEIFSMHCALSMAMVF